MMKVGLCSLALGLGLLFSGCATLDELRDGPTPLPLQTQTQTWSQQTTPQIPSEAFTLPPVTSPRVEQLPSYWYWADKQQQQFDRYLQQQWNLYYQNRQPPPQFTRPPVCTSTFLGGQVITTCQ